MSAGTARVDAAAELPAPRAALRQGARLRRAWPLVRPLWGTLVRAALASLAVVGFRLGLLWPLRRAMHLLLERGGGALADPGELLVLGLGFFGLSVALGVSDHLQRYQFACFAGSFASELRERALAGAGPALPGQQEGAEADLLARLIGDAARVRSGLKTLGVHVTPNALLLVGATAILCAMSLPLGTVFGVAVLAAAAVTLLGARRAANLAADRQRKERQLAQRVRAALTREPPGPAPRQADGRRVSEARIQQVEGRCTAAAYALVSLGVVGAMALGLRAARAGELAYGDLATALAFGYVLLRPTVRLVRRGVRAGSLVVSLRRMLEVIPGRTNRSSDPAQAGGPVEGDLR